MRSIAKSIVIGVFYLLALPAGLLALVFHKVLGSSVAFEFFAQIFSLTPGILGKYLRMCYYKQTLAESHLDTEYVFGCVITKITSKIGHRVGIGMYTSVGQVDIGDDTVIANYVSILSGGRQHNFDDPEKPIFSFNEGFSEVSIGTNCFIGEKTTVMANIGDKCIVGAGSVVVKDIPEYSVAVGNPARVVKDRRANGAAKTADARTGH